MDGEVNQFALLSGVELSAATEANGPNQASPPNVRRVSHVQAVGGLRFSISRVFLASSGCTSCKMDETLTVEGGSVKNDRPCEKLWKN